MYVSWFPHRQVKLLAINWIPTKIPSQKSTYIYVWRFLCKDTFLNQGQSQLGFFNISSLKRAKMMATFPVSNSTGWDSFIHRLQQCI